MLLYGLALVVVALNAIDLLQTKRLFRDYGPEGEANFMIRAIYRRWGFGAVIFFKAVLIGVAVCIALFLNPSGSWPHWRRCTSSLSFITGL